MPLEAVHDEATDMDLGVILHESEELTFVNFQEWKKESIEDALVLDTVI